jgi:dihydroorotate dehydrogenase (NAD+) catalytic subunit
VIAADFNNSTKVGDVVLKSPLLLASGTAGRSIELNSYVPLKDIGAIVVKSMAVFDWSGNKAPRLHPTAGGMINAVGLQGHGVAHWIEHDLPLLKQAGATVVASIWGFSVADYEAAARLIAPICHQIAALEINLSCPNIGMESHASGVQHSIFAHDAELSAQIIRLCAVANVPLWAKLSPNTDRVVEVARAAQGAGCQAVTLINTALGMAIDVETGSLTLGNGGGGLSGRAIHPLAVRTIFDVRTQLPTLPIVGVGGVTSGAEAVALLMAGASCVQIGTATFAEPRAAVRVDREMRRWAKRKRVNSWLEVINAAHKGGLSKS